MVRCRIIVVFSRFSQRLKSLSVEWPGPTQGQEKDQFVPTCMVCLFFTLSTVGQNKPLPSLVGQNASHGWWDFWQENSQGTKHCQGFLWGDRKWKVGCLAPWVFPPHRAVLFPFSPLPVCWLHKGVRRAQLTAPNRLPGNFRKSGFPL